MHRYQLFIDGAFIDAERGEWIESEDPYRGTAWTEIARATGSDVNRAVAAAVRAMESGPWGKMTATARGKILRRIGDLIVSNAARLAEIESKDNGKLLAEVRGQLNGVAECWYYYGGLADKIEGAVLPIDKPNVAMRLLSTSDRWNK